LVPKPESGRAPGPRQPEPHQAHGSGPGTSTNPRFVQVPQDSQGTPAGLPLEPLLQRLVDADVAPDTAYAFAACSAASQRAPPPAGSPARPPRSSSACPWHGISRSRSTRSRSRHGQHELHGDRWLAGLERGSRDRGKGGRDGSGFQACGRDPALPPSGQGAGEHVPDADLEPAVELSQGCESLARAV
jgi:hypothetical protein